jgi:hypothetical protein
VDVYTDASLADQIDDMNPGIAPSGLFWTTPIPVNSLDVNLGKGSASIKITDISIEDYGNFGNSLGGGPSVPATLSYEIHWFGQNSLDHVVSPDGLMTGQFVRNSAQMEWSATVGDYQFVSDPASTSFSSFAEIGHERNGIFFQGA